MTFPVVASPDGVAGLTPPTRVSGAKRRIGDVVVELGYASREQVEAAAIEGRGSGRLLGQVLVDCGALTSQQLGRILAERNGLPHLDLGVFSWDRAAASLIDIGLARRHGALPVAFVDDGALLVAMSDPGNILAVDDIRMATGYHSRRAVTSAEELAVVLSQLSRLDESIHEVSEEEHDDRAGSKDNGAESIEMRESAAEAPVVKFVNAIIVEAVERGASDVHLEPRRGDLRVRMRVDGLVADSTIVPRRLAPAVISRIKLMSELDISERRLPQDGRVGLTVDGRQVDLRVATLPVFRGEAVVMRVLDKGQTSPELEELGMDPVAREHFERAITARSGAVLVTGPTGSGKTTTLYAALQLINTADTTITTLEDPVEYELDGVKQVQVDTRKGLSFATGLRSLVRADPDVLMVGEVRDRETAQIAMEAALTGHLLLTTLHTRSAPTAAARLVEMGIEPFLVASGVNCVLAQRLVRRLCDCKRRVRLERASLVASGFDVARGFSAWEPAGCVRCSATGYRGRTGVYELLAVSGQIRELILGKATGDQLSETAQREGMVTMRAHGLAKIRAGETSVAEVVRVLGATP